MAKKKYTREKIIETGYNIQKDVGLERVTIRAIAKELGCSVMPIYEEFGTKEELYHEISSYSLERSMYLEDMYARYRYILAYGLKMPEQLLSFLDLKRQYDYQEELIEKLLFIMRKEPKLSRKTDQEILQLNARIELYIVGITYIYKKYDYSTENHKCLEQGLMTYVDVMVENMTKFS